MKLEILPIDHLPEIRSGANLAQCLANALQASGLELQSGDIVAITQKVVSKAEGRIVQLASVEPSAYSTSIGRRMKKDPNIWVFDRCGDEGCSKSNASPIFHLGPDGKTIKNFGAGEFASAHGIAVDKDGNVWAADFQSKDGKGMQVTKFSPDGKVLLKLGKAGESGMGDDTLKSAERPCGSFHRRNPGCRRPRFPSSTNRVSTSTARTANS